MRVCRVGITRPGEDVFTKMDDLVPKSGWLAASHIVITSIIPSHHHAMTPSHHHIITHTRARKMESTQAWSKQSTHLSSVDKALCSAVPSVRHGTRSRFGTRETNCRTPWRIDCSRRV
jgi:hypothetical protein